MKPGMVADPNVIPTKRSEVQGHILRLKLVWSSSGREAEEKEFKVSLRCIANSTAA